MWVRIPPRAYAPLDRGFGRPGWAGWADEWPDRRSGRLERRVRLGQPGEVESANSVVGAEREHRWDRLTRHETGLCGQGVEGLEVPGDLAGAVDQGGDDGHAAPQLEESVSVGCVVAVEAPDSPDARRSGGTGLTQPADQLEVNGSPVAGRALGRVKGQPLPDRAAGLVGAGELVRSGEETPSRFQKRTSSSTSCAAGTSLRNFGSIPEIAGREPTATTIIGTSALLAKKAARALRPWLVPSTPSRTLAPAIPWEWRSSQTSTNAGCPPARSRRPMKTVSFVSGAIGDRVAGPAGVGGSGATSRALSSVIRPRRWISSTRSRVDRMRSGMSTATATTGRSPEREWERRRSVWRW